MTESLNSIGQHCHTLSDSIRWACILEATAPKAGNVYPGRPFADLNFTHFVQAAEITADCLTRFDQPIGQRMLDCVRSSRSATGTNVNLGIVLLLAPLADSFHTSRSVGEVLSSLDQSDGQQIFEAIKVAGAGGLGEVEQMDVHSSSETIDVVAAMRLAADRDRIALQYASDFTDLHDNLIPILLDAITNRGDLLLGISEAHVRLLASSPDSLIQRKFGREVAKQVQQLASEVDHSSTMSRKRLDDFLRPDGNPEGLQLNPGTTADVIAAALFVLLNSNS
ncbi:ATP:dephospho-CoA triphosphoribosyl transferase [Rubripirellula obstinata]|uniref:ATP:dephospho-CoA triphosphoribosyl transferase n=1 Tax=Rubripirellula obstinata TaxID=406547 RepID=A0A5B1CED2_9BACT|nr:triphosphoribosyl-dephospho-CoA synthase [Rubripirellula obstinata]KAA1257823.1 ATP:dephospho-CoA triphosphoribosyl transferase [Rubripirellula obstinata]